MFNKFKENVIVYLQPLLPKTIPHVENKLIKNEIRKCKKANNHLQDECMSRITKGGTMNVTLSISRRWKSINTCTPENY